MTKSAEDYRNYIVSKLDKMLNEYVEGPPDRVVRRPGQELARVQLEPRARLATRLTFLLAVRKWEVKLLKTLLADTEAIADAKRVAGAKQAAEAAFGNVACTHDAWKTQPDAMPPASASEPMTTDYCTVCGESPESATHILGPDRHDYRRP